MSIFAYIGKGMDMKFKTFFIIIYLLFVVSNIYATPVLHLNANNTHYDDFSMAYSEETSPALLDSHKIKQIKFDTHIQNSFSLGYKENAVWFYFKITNDLADTNEMILEISEMFHQKVDLYAFSDVTPLYHEKNGLSVPIYERHIKNINPAFHLRFNPHESKEIYLRIDSIYGLFGEVTLKSPEIYYSHTQVINNLFIFYFGAVLIIALYNFFIFIYLKEKIYIYYVSYVLSFALWVSLYKGFISYYIDIDTYNLIQITIPTFFMMLTLFSQSILDTKTHVPFIHKVLNLFLLILLCSLVWMLLSLHDGFKFMNIALTPLLPLLLFTAIRISKKGNRIATIYLLVLFIYFIGMSLVSILALGLIPYHYMVSQAPVIGSFFEIILFSLLLAYRINLLREEKLHTQSELLRVKATESTRLIKMVNEKTAELNTLNKKLAKELEEKQVLEKRLMFEASTDALTGILNRRSFFDTCTKEVKSAKRYRHDLSLMIIDIDYFKQINDTYGHLNGDIVLMDLVNIIKQTIRNTDILGRIGGEEFAVLMPETNAQNAMNLAERIRQNIETNSSVIDEQPVTITVSIGLCLMQPKDMVIQTVLRRADLALFKAKENGRNQVLSHSHL